MTLVSKTLAPNAPFVDFPSGVLTRQGNNYLNSLTVLANTAAGGTIATGPGSGLAGGGDTAGNLSLSIAPNGVTNGMIRQSAAYSVIGRAFGTAGNVADIAASANGRVLARMGGVLAFFSDLDGVSIGTNIAAPLVRCTDLRIDQAPTAEVIVCTHTITISANGTDYKIPIVAA